MNPEYRLRTEKWRNLLIFFMINLLVIFLVSMIKIDYASNNFIRIELSLNFDLIFIMEIIIITIFLQLIVLYTQIFLVFRRQGVFQIFPRQEIPNNFSNPFSLEKKSYDLQEIINSVLSIAEKVNISVKRIYLTLTPIPNAFTLNVPFIGSIINIDSNLVDILDSDSLNTVISHEIGHIKKSDSMLKLIIISPYTYLQIALIFLYIQLFAGIVEGLIINNDLISAFSRIFIFVLVYYFSRIITSISSLFLFKAERAAESSADIFAGKITSPILVINALIKLGQRTEVINELLDGFKQMESLQRKLLTPEDTSRLINLLNLYPVSEIDQKQARIFAPYIYLVGQLRLLKNAYMVPLNDEMIHKIAVESVNNLISVQKITFDPSESKLYAKLTKDWRTYDANQDQFIDETELFAFIDMLRRMPNKFLFKSEIPRNFLMQDHPDFRNRILTLYEQFYE